MMLGYLFFHLIIKYEVFLFSETKFRRTIGAVKEILFIKHTYFHSLCVRVYFNLLMYFLYYAHLGIVIWALF